jgi:hypothetical protein
MLFGAVLALITLQGSKKEKVSVMKLPTEQTSQLAFHADRRNEQGLVAPTRRRTERLQGPWAAEVRGKDEQGKRFTEFTIL